MQKQIDDLKAQAGNVQTQAVDDFCDFLVWLRKNTYSEETNSSDCSAALGYLASAWGITPSGNIEDYTNLHSPDDATAIDNILASLDMIDQLNAIRKAEGLNELEVSLFAMCEAAMHANWSAETGTTDHAVNHGYGQQWGGTWGENAAWGYTAADGPRDFFTGWYYQEKADYTQQAQTDPSTGKVYQPHAKGDPAYQTGHYTTIISSGKKYTGMAYRPTSNTGYGSTAVNVFGSSNTAMGNASRDKTYTTDALRQLIAQAQDEGVVLYHFDGGNLIYDSVEPGEGGSANQDAINKLEDQLADLKSQLATAEQTAADKQQAYDGAVADKTEANKALAAIGERPTDESLQQAVADAQAALKQAEAEKAKADANLTQVKADAEAKLAELNGQKSDLQTKLDEANADIAGLTQAAEDALADLNQAKENNQAVIDAGDAYRAAKANLATAEDALAAAQETVDDLNDAIADTTAKVVDAQKAVDAAENAYDQSGPTAEQKQALTDAEAALKNATDELNRLTEARDKAKKTADAAQQAVDANAALMSGLEAAIAEQQALIDDADAKLPEATAKRDAWTAVFEQQSAEDIVKNGFTGTTSDTDVAAALAGAHGAYDDKLDELARAEAALDAANEALEAAQANKATSAEDLAEAMADQALAQEAYDRVKAEVDALLAKQEPAEEPVQQASQRTPEQQARLETLPTTGDPAAVWAAGLAVAGHAAAAGGAHFRRRDEE